MNDEPHTYEIPANARLATCKSCPASIYWVRTQKGKWCPVNADGKSHFLTCPNASQHSRKGKK